MFGDCLIGIDLHPGVDGGIDLQSVRVEVKGFAGRGVLMFFTPFLQLVADDVAEIGGQSVVLVDLFIIAEIDRAGFVAVAILICGCNCI